MTLKALTLAAAILAIGSAAHAETIKYTAQLKGADEVPANTETGTGAVTASYDTASKMFHYDVTYSGLTGPATAAHFHGPAMAGANAPPVVPITPPVSSPISGMATLTDAQAADLQAGKWYFNVHTAAHGGGEIRGQLKAQ